MGLYYQDTASQDELPISSSNDPSLVYQLEAGSFTSVLSRSSDEKHALELFSDESYHTSLSKSKPHWCTKLLILTGIWLVTFFLTFAFWANNETGQVDSNEIVLKPYSYLDQDYSEDLLVSNFDEKRLLTLKELRSGKFAPDIRDIQWIHSNDSGTYLTKKNNQYIISKIEDPSYSKTLYDSKYFHYNGIRYQIDDLVASPDLNFAVLATNRSMIWRHSSKNLLWVLNVAEKQISPLTTSDNLHDTLFFAKWAPNSNFLAFVKASDQNIYVKDIAGGTVKQVTFDGDANIFNGKPDWVYEEEVFENEFALWWSPNSEYLTFLKFNDTKVDNFPIDYFVSDENPDSSYPKATKIKYPKAGYSNPQVSVNIYNVHKDHYSQIFHNFKTEENANDAFYEFLVTELLWVGNDKLYLRTTNRISSILKVVIVDANELSYEIVRDEKIDNSWFELSHDTVYVPKDANKDRFEDGYIDTISVDGYNHLAYYSPVNASEPFSILTRGDYEVVGGVSSFDADTNKVYFISTKFSSIDRHLYSVDLLTGQGLVALTDDSTSGYYDASFSTDSKNALVSYLGPEIPYQKIVSLRDSSEGLAISSDEFLTDVFTRGKNITTNEKLAKIIAGYKLPSTQFGEISLGEDENGDRIFANVREIKPFRFDSSKKYPLFVYVYQGPNSQLITSKFSVSLLQVLASSLNAVVLTVDGRGTGFKGKAFRSVVYQNLSHYETIDQIKAAKIYTTTKSYIDPERTLIYGHSYGGYMTLKTLENDHEKVFKYGISGAPVTDWRLYDSIYTERYMSLPQLNNKNYATGSVGGSGNFTNFQRTKRFLILHGTGDDNVHIQNLYRLLDKLNRANVENNYDLVIFPDSNHGIYYHNAGYIMYNKIIWWSKMAFSGEFDKFDDYDYHNGNLDKAVGIAVDGQGYYGYHKQQNRDVDDEDFLRF